MNNPKAQALLDEVEAELRVVAGNMFHNRKLIQTILADRKALIEALEEIDDGGYRGDSYRNPLDVAANALEASWARIAELNDK